MNNPMQMLKVLRTMGNNPEQMVTRMMGNNSNPMIGNLINLAKQGKNQDIETFARNICKEKRNRF